MSHGETDTKETPELIELVHDVIAKKNRLREQVAALLRSEPVGEPVEEWRGHPVHAGLEVSSMGRVRRNGMAAKLVLNDKGYLYASCGNGHPRGVGVLVLEAFISERPDGHDCDHINADRTDNRLVNLRWLDRTKNRSVYGRKNSATKLTREEVKAIRASSETMKALGKRYGVDRSLIGQIKRRVIWRDV